MAKKFEIDYGGKKLEVETGLLAPRADKALKVQYGDTVVLVTVCIEDEPREGIDYFPLMVDYEEKLYAAGTIKGSRWIKREGRPSVEARITSRMIDRVLRPRFNQSMRNDVQVVATVLSMDDDQDPDIPALIGASAALHASEIPWDGPLAGVRMGKVDGEWKLNPTFEEREEGEFDLVVAGDEETINMLESYGDEITEKEFFQAVKKARKPIKELVSFQKELREKIGNQKRSIEKEKLPAEVKKTAEDFLTKDKLKEAVCTKELEVTSGPSDLKEELLETLKEEFASNYEDWASVEDLVSHYFEEKVKESVVDEVLEKGKRPDGREVDQVRSLQCKAGILPRPHGSALFSRGLTQAISVVTLGGPDLEQMLEEMEGESTKRYMHHYNFPPFSVGEVQPMRGPGRREIGHGMLAERALDALIPSREEFPYTIRVVSEIASSNGSSSMASVCGSTLSLLDAGVELKRNAAGVAMGIMKKDDDYKILTDIQGPEDHYGGMDLKVAGTREGITAVQMDVKIKGLTDKMLKEALDQAKEARLEILDAMEEEVASARELSPQVPKVKSIEIPPAKIREIIGPGGKTIRKITEETGAEISVEDSGEVFITADKKEEVEEAASVIHNIVKEVKKGEVFKGEVVSTKDFGAFVEIAPGRDGLIHISNLSSDYVESVEDELSVGDKVEVKVVEKKDGGKIGFKLLSKLS